MKSRKSWVMLLPKGLRDQPGWIFIGTLSALSGLSYMLGLSKSSITQVLDVVYVRTWGGFLFVAGFLVVYATVRLNRPLEKMALRLLSLGYLIYMGWVVVAVSLERATIVVMMCLSLVVLSEIRIAVLRILLKPLPETVRDLEVP